MIGICDYDFISSRKKLSIPNLEAMKTAAFFERKNKSPTLITDIDNIDQFDEIFFFSDKTLAEVPISILKQNNVHMHGKAFYGKEYSPMEPNSIERMVPSTRMYKQILSDKYYGENINEQKVLSFLESSYYRAYVQENRIQLPPGIIKNRRFYIYDDNLLKYQDWKDILSEISAFNPSSIRTIHPVLCKNLEDFFYIRNFESFSKENEIILDFDITQEQAKNYIIQDKVKLQESIVKASNVFIYIGKNYARDYYDDLFFTRDLIKKLKTLFIFWKKGIYIKLINYNVTGKVPNPYNDIFEKICKWTQSNDKTGSIMSDVLKNKNRKLNGCYNSLMNYSEEFFNLFQITKKELWG